MIDGCFLFYGGYWLVADIQCDNASVCHLEIVNSGFCPVFAVCNF
jgi:hypothetical protein